MDMPLATPILAHPERNRHLVENPSIIRDLVKRGIEIQINSGSLEGIFGESARRTARCLLKEAAARLVASDAHGPLGRSTDLSGAARALSSLLGEEAPRLILGENPGLILEGEELASTVSDSQLTSRPSRKRSWRRSR
jgi:protein-tyrosine phosphatase